MELGGGWKGVLGTGYQSRETPQAIPNMTDFIEVAAGSEHVLALRKDGTVWSWGDNEKGQLGYKEGGVSYGPPNEIRFRPHQLTPKQIPDLTEVVSIAAGRNYSLALDKQGRVWGWGSDLFMFSQDEKFKQATPRLIVQDENVVKVIGSGSDLFALLFKTGRVQLWTTKKTWEPSFEAPLVDVVISGLNSYFLLNTGRIYALGYSASGELAQRGKSDYETPQLITQIGRIVKIALYTALDDKGRVWQWGGVAGRNIDKTFTGGNIYSQYFPRVMVSDKEIVDIYCCSFALSKDGTVWAWEMILGE